MLGARLGQSIDASIFADEIGGRDKLPVGKNIRWSEAVSFRFDDRGCGETIWQGLNAREECVGPRIRIRCCVSVV
jgi:hypothetical protein